MHFLSRARRLPVLFGSAALLSAGLASPAMAAEDLQPLPPIQEAARGSLGSSIGDALGSSSACTKLENQLAEIKELWDTAVAEEDYDLANFIRIDYTNMAVSLYQCNLAKGSL
ncbi:hypothetical protein [Corynebacterium dentalis]|uniref:hypothetical protein n=1 Tax=Corynebacterium dentalis TaxID=2014528 RepID=UPI00289A9BA7|nr:hypothetical protein [Corynebacterium dentalis]